MKLPHRISREVVVTHAWYRVSLAPRLAGVLAEHDLSMDGHTWAAACVATARADLRRAGAALVRGLADRLALDGWVIAALPPELPDEQLRCAAAGVLAGVGLPFFSIDGGHGLWLDGPSGPERAPNSFGGFDAQALPLAAPHV